MAKKISITFKQLMDMERPEFEAFVIENGYAAALAPILARKTQKKVYPKVMKPMKKPTPAQIKKNPKLAETYNPNKLTPQSDKTATPKIVMKPITFFEAKTAFAEEVLHLPKAEKAKKPTFRDVIIAAANADN